MHTWYGDACVKPKGKAVRSRAKASVLAPLTRQSVSAALSHIYMCMERLYHVVVAALGAFISGRLADVLFWLGYLFLKQLFNFYFFEFFFFLFHCACPNRHFFTFTLPASQQHSSDTLLLYKCVCESVKDGKRELRELLQHPKTIAATQSFASVFITTTPTSRYDSLQPPPRR